MAVGDLVKLGAWKLTKPTGSITYAYNQTSWLDYESYTKIEIDFSYTDNNALCWYEYKINNKKAYIGVSSGLCYISKSEAESFCNQTVTINDTKYKYSFMSVSQWMDVYYMIIPQFGLTRESEIWTSDNYTTIYYNEFNKFEKCDRIVDTSEGNIYYVPVLVQINNPPIISGNDEDLGNKTASFSVTYSVSDIDIGQELTVIEKLNETVIRTLQNPTQNSTLTFTITDELFASLSMNTTNTIEIEVTDGSATTYRRYTFVKTNSAPLINYAGQLDLGQLTAKPTVTYSVRDNEGDTITVTEKLNGEVIKQFTATSNTDYTITISDEFWLSCGSDTNTIEISASDANGGTSYKYITFTRQVNKVQIVTKNPIETDVAATKIMVSPDYSKTGCTIKIEVCNNGYDASPTWEDMTTMVALNRPYVFTNSTKTAGKWGIKIRLTLTKNEGYTGEAAIYGFGGAFE